MFGFVDLQYNLHVFDNLSVFFYKPLLLLFDNIDLADLLVLTYVRKLEHIDVQ